jgi:hypothetical protein
MNNLRAAIVCFFFFSSLLSCSQTKLGIKNVYAFKAIQNRGTIAVDENGKPLTPAVDTLQIIYVETEQRPIIWEHAWKDNKTYNISAVQMTQKQIEIGKEKGTQRNISISASKGGQLWLLEFSPSDNLPAPATINHGSILIQYKLNGKKILRTISHQTELSLPEAM